MSDQTTKKAKLVYTLYNLLVDIRKEAADAINFLNLGGNFEEDGRFLVQKCTAIDDLVDVFWVSLGHALEAPDFGGFGGWTPGVAQATARRMKAVERLLFDVLGSSLVDPVFEPTPGDDAASVADRRSQKSRGNQDHER